MLPPSTTTSAVPSVVSTRPARMFMGGLPMKPATKALAGRSWTVRGASTCWRAPSRRMAMRCPMVMASTWSWVT